ncbi:MAG: phage tail sheath subtilisin-like domain-containing protein [Deltaproteobacteria bacterium]|nr:phage tail sheath subtilisin-like domain-containing protein [Deltaproteobacteria bacterium]
MAIQFDSIPSSIRKPGKYFEFNTKLAVRTLASNKYRMVIIGQRLKAYIEPARFQGGTLNNMNSGGAFVGSTKKDFIVKISTAAATDRFQYSTDGGINWSIETDLTLTALPLEEGVEVTFGAVTGHAVGDEWRFSAWPEPSVAEAVPTQVFSDTEVAEKFGYGSMVHLMAKAALKANRYLDLSVCALDDVGAASSGSVTIGGPATSSGSLSLYIGNKKIEIGIENNKTSEEIAVDLQNGIAAYPDVPVVAAVNGSVINLTAKNGGDLGNQVTINTEVTASAVSAVVSPMSGSAANPDVNSALSAIFADDYNIIATPYNNEVDLVTVRDHLDSVSGPLEQRPATAFYGMTGDLGTATTLAANINSGRIGSPYVRFTRSLPYEVASAFASVLAGVEDPAMPLNTVELKGIHAPVISDRLSRSEQESCLYNGVTPLEIGPGEKVQVVRAISTYIKDGNGIDDISLLDITTIRTLDYVRKATMQRVALRFPQTKKTIRVKDAIKTELLDVAYKMEELEILENVDEHKGSFIVEDDLVDPSRVNAKIPADIVNGLHVFAGRIDLLL